MTISCVDAVYLAGTGACAFFYYSASETSAIGHYEALCPSRHTSPPAKFELVLADEPLTHSKRLLLLRACSLTTLFVRGGMPKKVDWQPIANNGTQALALQASDDLARAPPLLDTFSHTCWEYFLKTFGCYVVLQSSQTNPKGAMVHVGTFNCVGHKKCAYQIRAELYDRRIEFIHRADKSHTEEDRKIEGMTVAQWQVFVRSSAPTPDALALCFSRSGQPCPPKARLKSLLGVKRETFETKAATISNGALRQWLHERSRAALEAAGLLSPYKLVYVMGSGVDADDAETFSVAFVTEHWMDVCSRISVDEVGLDVFADGKHKNTERRELCAALQDEGQDASAKSSAPSSDGDDDDEDKIVIKRKKKRNDIVTIVFGFSTVHYTHGAVERRKGGIKKHRPSFNPLSVTFVRGGESERAYQLGINAAIAYAKDHHPAVAARLQTVLGACSDFTGGCRLAYSASFDAKKIDHYIDDARVLVPQVRCLLKACVEHALRNVAETGGAGMKKFVGPPVAPQAKEHIASFLHDRISFSSRRLNLVWFDIVWHYTLHELRESGTIEATGLQASWATYFEKQYLFKEEVDGCSLHNALWRNGPDRPQPRSSNNLAESYNSKLDALGKRVMKTMIAELGVRARPTLPEYIRRLEHAVELDNALNTKHTQQVLHRLPTDVDSNLLTGHDSITRHTLRLPSKAYVAAASERPMCVTNSFAGLGSIMSWLQAENRTQLRPQKLTTAAPKKSLICILCRLTLIVIAVCSWAKEFSRAIIFRCRRSRASSASTPSSEPIRGK